MAIWPWRCDPITRASPHGTPRDDHGVFADAPPPPYVAVIFTSLRNGSDDGGYGAMAQRMDDLAAQQPGYIGVESARDADGLGITVSYWATAAAAGAWKQVTEHLGAQEGGRTQWYRRYVVRIATVDRQYGWAEQDVQSAS
jgi:heme-degrading monooxygenase HmoA